MMVSEILIKAMTIIGGYLDKNYTNNDVERINIEISTILGNTINISANNSLVAYEDVQKNLSTLNERESIRRRKGVYYTPSDVVKFILFNSFKLATGNLNADNVNTMNIDDLSYELLCLKKTIFDPTCGAGEFLLSALELKMDLLDIHCEEVTKDEIRRVVKTIHGNDINIESVTISKLRIFLSVLHRYGIEKVIGLGKILNSSFFNYDYISKNGWDKDNKYDIIVGNPPYVEVSKSGLSVEKSYGNIYANVLENASLQLNEGGVIGFIVPLSYISTPRMRKIREVLYESVPEQYILNYSDRPDCLFKAVHQKLSILLARKKDMKPLIYTSSYKYWYKEEREELFSSALVVKNDFVEELFIPKIGSKIDSDIYEKVNSYSKTILSLFDGGDNSVYLNMRAAFWIKAFLNSHEGAEYKKFSSTSDKETKYAMCLFNSSIFWWYWICVSDCWHITRKELNGFKIPDNVDYGKISKLATNLENKLEETKVYIGTKQTKYEYKHRMCIKEIHDIDDYINQLFGLSEEESLYIKNFAFRYRISGGLKSGCN